MEMKHIKQIRERSRLFACQLEQIIHTSQKRWSLPIILLRYIAKDKKLLITLLAFVEILPSLHTTKQIQEYVAHNPGDDVLCTFPFFARLVYCVMGLPILGAMCAIIMRYVIYAKLAPYFMIVDDVQLQKVIHCYRDDGIKTAVSILGELVSCEDEAISFLRRYMDIMRSPRCQGRQAREKIALVFPRAWVNTEPMHIAVKFSSLFYRFGPENYSESKNIVEERFRRILRVAKENKSFVMVDAEHYIFRNLIEDIFCKVILEPDFRDMTNVGIALQAYLKDSICSAERFISIAKQRGVPFFIRLVRGAYWDEEVVLAQKNNMEVPVFEGKKLTDMQFDCLVYYLFKHWHIAYTVLATHNPCSIVFACEVAKQFEIINDSHLQFQVLYGMGEPVRKALHAFSVPTLVYLPMGDMQTGMSYFVRRILENTANQEFLLKLIRRQ